MKRLQRIARTTSLMAVMSCVAVLRAAAQESASAVPRFADLALPVSSFGAAEAGGYLYVYGGHCVKTHSYSTESVTSRFLRVSLDGGEWESLPGGAAIQGLAVVAHGGKIYRIGGMHPRNKPGEKADNVSITGCAVFDPKTRAWTDLPDLPKGRSSHDAVVVGDRIYVVGGWNMRGVGNASEWHDEALVLDLTRQPMAWVPFKQPFERRALTAAAFQGKIYVIAGFTEESDIHMTVNIFDPATNAWSLGPDIPEPNRNGFTPASAVAAGRLYLSTADGNVFCLSPDGKSWDKTSRLQNPRIVHRMIGARDRFLVAVGGASREGNVAATETVPLP